MGTVPPVLVEAFRERGHQLWLVGGSLRDRVMGLGDTSHDLDYATDALPDVVEEIARGLHASVTTVGKRYGTIGVQVLVFKGEVLGKGEQPVAPPPEAEKKPARKPGVRNAAAS